MRPNANKRPGTAVGRLVVPVTQLFRRSFRSKGIGTIVKVCANPTAITNSLIVACRARRSMSYQQCMKGKGRCP